MKKLVLPFILLPLVATFVTAKEYTPEQLKQMVNSGNYPAQGKSESNSKSMDFGKCVMKAQSMMSAISSNYPVSVITDTSIIYVVKAWVNDASMVITCSKSDNKMVITQSPYK